MARMKRGARTEAVRNYLAEHPDASPKMVVEGLKEKGIRVKLTLVNGIKYKAGKPGKRRRSPGVRMAARKTHPIGGTFEQLVEVKRLADSLGGTDNVRHALDMLDQLR